MSRLRKHRHTGQEAELNVTAFLNLMVVLVPFLLISAVFSQVAILELNMPQPSKQAKKDKPNEKKERVEVILREGRIQVSNGEVVKLTIEADAESGEFDLAQLTDYLRLAKQRQPEKLDSSILLEPEIEYERLVTIMDALKVDVTTADDGQTQQQELFPVVSIGDAPVANSTNGGV